MCAFVLGEGMGGGGTPHMHGHKESYNDLNLKNLTYQWDSTSKLDSNPRPHDTSLTLYQLSYREI